MKRSGSIPVATGIFGLAFLGLASCASRKQITITSDPPGATVFLDGVNRGITEFKDELRFERDQSYSVTLKKEGYEDATAQIALEPRDQTTYDLQLQKIEAVTVPLVSVEPRPTPGGKVELQITRKPTLAYLETIERSPNLSTVSQITFNEDEDVQIESPMLSPVDEELVYTEIIKEDENTSYSNIIRQKPGSPAKAPITFGKWLDQYPCFTPDGKQIVFSSNRTNANPTLWRVLLSGEGGLTKLTSSLAHDFSPSVSRDGVRVAYASLPRAAEDRQVWTIEASGSYPTQLREGEQPRLSPDGQRILFVRVDRKTARRQIWVMSVTGGDETLLTSNFDYDVTDPQWSPSGQWIVYASDEGLDSKKKRNFDIWAMRTDGSRKTQLTTNGSHDDSPCWNHDGSYIYFRSNRGKFWNIWRFRPAL